MNDDNMNLDLQESDDDLDAQLAALGLFDDLDDDSGGDDESVFDLDAAFGMSETGSGAGDETDLDRQLEMLLMADQTATENFEIKDVSMAGPSQSVYDPEVDGIGMVSYVRGSHDTKSESKSTPIFENVSWATIAVTALLGLVFISVIAVAVLYAAAAIREQQDAIELTEHFVPIELPQNTANNTNTLFINHNIELGEQMFTLTHITAGATGTLFYFAEDIILDDYIFLLYNQAGNLFGRTTFDIERATSGSVLMFESLSSNTLFLTLHIQNRQTHEYIRFEYRFLRPPTFAQPVFYSRRMPVESETELHLSGLTLRHGLFDNATSRIHYSFTSTVGDQGYRINEANNVSLRDALTLPSRLTAEPAYVYFEDFGIFMGSAVFAPVLSLDSTVHAQFHGIQYFYPAPEVDISVTELFNRDQRGVPHSIPTGTMTLNLEAMEQQGFLVILTMHGVDETNQRRRTDAGMRLRIQTENGEIFVQGSANVAPQGTDMLFNLQPHIQDILTVYMDEYSLVIDWVEYEIPQISMPVPLSTTFNTPSIRRVSAELAVHEAFMSLLAYKSGHIESVGLIGLSNEKRNNDNFMSLFAPQNTSLRPMYSAVVVTGDLVTNYDYLSIVEVQWVVGEGNEMQYFHVIFQVVSQSQDGIWSIVDVRVLEG